MGPPSSAARARSRSPPGRLTDLAVLERVATLVREVRALRAETAGTLARTDALVGEVANLRTILESHLRTGNPRAP